MMLYAPTELVRFQVY